MMFTYGPGQRPLEGYTIQRGLGRGGFGEVYQARSDGGKEVALKLLRGDAATELRGIRQCLNCKHPNLVALYDLRQDPQGNYWVVMEYVAGESLQEILRRHPQGLPHDLIRDWFPGLAAGVAFLHDQGIVHRDLKPGNIFIEHGIAKVGDYGLSKLLQGACGSRHSCSVGTVHYMAPETLHGRYDHRVDIYAAGIILYEMLCGRPPFTGETVGEVLMRHLTELPDLRPLPPALVPVLTRALAKDPQERPQSMQELAQAVTAALSPAVVPVALPAAPPRPPDPATVSDTTPPPEARPARTLRQTLAEQCRALWLSALLSAICASAGMLLSGQQDLVEWGRTFFLTLSACWAVLLPSCFWRPAVPESLERRCLLFGLGLLLGGEALALEGYSFPELWSEVVSASRQELVRPRDVPAGGDLSFALAAPVALRYLGYFGLAFFLLRWWRLTDCRRAQRCRLTAPLLAAFWGGFLYLLLPLETIGRGLIPLSAAALIVQLVSPWQPAPATPPRRYRLRPGTAPGPWPLPVRERYVVCR
jgi:hypothetical protein